MMHAGPLGGGRPGLHHARCEEEVRRPRAKHPRTITPCCRRMIGPVIAGAIRTAARADAEHCGHVRESHDDERCVVARLLPRVQRRSIECWQ